MSNALCYFTYIVIPKENASCYNAVYDIVQCLHKRFGCLCLGILCDTNTKSVKDEDGGVDADAVCHSRQWRPATGAVPVSPAAVVSPGVAGDTLTAACVDTP